MILEVFVALNMFQAPPPAKKNPTVLVFACADHDRDDQHEVDIVRDSDGQVIQTLLVGDPPAASNGDVEVNVNVQPVAFGRYHFVARSVAGSLKSNNSTPSEVWERGPVAPEIRSIR